MEIVFASSEVVPFAKTGGLADVSGALPQELAKLGHDVSVFMPAYRCVFQSDVPLELTDIELRISIGSKTVQGQVFRTVLPGSGVPIFLIQNEGYFDRENLYMGGGEDYSDNCERFVFFSRAVLESIRQLNLSPDVIHCNDWQTGIIPAILKTECVGTPPFETTSSLITVHNLAYQGNFWHWDMLVTGLDWKYFNWREMEFFGRLNLLKTGLVFADSINTVSPTYAEEIKTPEQGCGLEGTLQHRSDDLTGILNGIDTGQWNPVTDPLIAAKYDSHSWKSGKRFCKSALQRSCSLIEDPDIPLIGIIGRLADQKGWSLILDVMRQWLPTVAAQWVILGSGSPDYESQLSQLANQYPQKLSANLMFSNELAHQIEAGADMFLMPSQYEPCGLNQMYSMAYGTVPVVRRTGGLADTVFDANSETIRAKIATGFVFEEFTAGALAQTLARATNMFVENRDEWKQLVENGMARDSSWRISALSYERLYRKMVAKKKSLLESA